MSPGGGLFSAPSCPGSIVSAATFHFRVRNENGWVRRALTTKDRSIARGSGNSNPLRPVLRRSFRNSTFVLPSGPLDRRRHSLPIPVGRSTPLAPVVLRSDCPDPPGAHGTPTGTSSPWRPSCLPRRLHSPRAQASTARQGTTRAPARAEPSPLSPDTTKPPLARRLRIQSLVAGEGFEPPTFGL